MAIDTKPSQPSPAHRERRVDQAVEETFPASDPTTAGSLQGARAVPPEEMMHAAEAQPAAPADAVTLRHRFRDAAAAKLALEALVREGPIDRRLAELSPEGDGAAISVTVPREDTDRIGDLLRRQGGEEGGGTA